MSRCVRLAFMVVFFLLLPLAKVYAQSFEILTPQVKPGGLVVVRVLGSSLGDETGVCIFYSIYQPNKEGVVFAGVPLGLKSDSYPVYLMNRLSGERIGEFTQQELLVVPDDIKVRPLGKLTPPSKKRVKEVLAITASYRKANYAEFYAEDDFQDPLLKLFVTSNFAVNHGGTDLRAPAGTKVSAINSGRVIMTAKNFSLEGNMVIIDHGSGIFSYYMHLSKIQVKDGHKVVRGQVVGLSGATGHTVGPHLHFAVKVNGTNVNSLAFIDTVNTVFYSK